MNIVDPLGGLPTGPALPSMPSGPVSPAFNAVVTNPLVNPYIYVPPGPTPNPPPAPPTPIPSSAIKNGDASWGQPIPSSFGLRRVTGVPIWFNGIQTTGVVPGQAAAPPPVRIGPVGPNPQWGP